MDTKAIAILILIVALFVGFQLRESYVSSSSGSPNYYRACRGLDDCSQEAPFTLLVPQSNYTVRELNATARPEYDVNYVVIERTTDTYVYRSPLLIRTSRLKDCEYVGKINPYINCTAGVTHGTFNGFIVAVTPDQENDQPESVKEIEAAIASESNEDLKRRYVFTLAQRYEKENDYKKAVETYRERVKMGGWGEEVFYSQYRIAISLLRENQTTDAKVALLQAYHMNPHRKEPLYYLARISRVEGDFPICLLYTRTALTMGVPGIGSLFVESEIYSWKIYDEHALCLFYAGKQSEAREIWKDLLQHPHVGEEQRERIKENLKF